MKTTSNNKVIARKVLNAIINGAHSMEMIIRNQELYAERDKVCDTIKRMQTDGIIEYHNRNMANEYAYYITDEGWKIF